jgi:S1-C subfamily serine protease
MKLSKSNVVVSIILAVIVCCFMFSYGPTASCASGFMDLELSIKELEHIVEKASPGVAMVVFYDDSGEESGRGSGCFIDRKGMIITNASIMKDAYSAEVISKSNQYDDIIILHRDDTLDIALIQVKAADETPLELDFEYEIKPGERVAVIGKSPDLKKTVSEGLISSVGDKSEIIEFKTTKPLLSFRESKDGPLLNMSGKVIGVMSTAIHDSQNIDGITRMPDYQNFKAISIASIKQFISRPDNAEHLHPAKSKIWTRWMNKWLKNAALTVFVTLYAIGFPKLLAMAFILILIISAFQWLSIKLKKGRIK